MRVASAALALVFAARWSTADPAGPESMPSAPVPSQPHPAPDLANEAGTVIVMMSEASPNSPMSRLADVLRSQLAEVGVTVELRVESGAPESPLEDSSRNVIAMIWIERSEEALVVHFYEPAGSSLKERYIPVTGDDTASVEEIAVVVRSAIGALLERTRGATPPQAPVPAPKRKRPARPPLRPTPEARKASPSAQLSIAYLLTHYASDTAWQHGPSLSAAWHARGVPLAVGLGYAWLPELRRTEGELTVAIERHPVEAFLGAGLTVSDELRLEPEFGIVADPITRTTTEASRTMEITPPARRWSWAASARLRVSWSPVPRVWLFGAGGADTLLNRFESVVGGDTERTVLSPLRVRPRFQLGSAIDL